jgi:hypothetical protein
VFGLIGFLFGVITGAGTLVGITLWLVGRDVQRVEHYDESYPIGQQLADEMGIELSV